MFKVKVRWSGFIGSPGWSNFYFDTGTEDFHTDEDAVHAATKVQSFFNTVKIKLPPQVTTTVQSDVEVLSNQTGELLRVATVPAQPVNQNTAPAGPYSAASGVVLTWRTAGVRNGRRVRGRTFLVPVANGVYQSDGTIEPANLTDLVTAGTALAADTGNVRLGVFSRPSAQGASDGQWFPVTSVSVPDIAAVLKTRRG